MRDSKAWIQLNELDNVAVCCTKEGLKPGDALGTQTVSEVVPWGHKVALRELEAQAPVIKFGHVIGVTTRAIRVGQHVHVHNVAMPPAEALAQGPTQLTTQATPIARAALPTHFRGYQRQDGRVGTRNYVAVTASVNCSATVVKAVCRHFSAAQLASRGVDGVIPITHALGCAQAIGGLGYTVLNRTLAGWVFHPNVVGAVVIGLGCEGTTFRSVLATHEASPNRHAIELEHFSIQDVGGTAKAIAEGIAAVERILARLPSYERQSLPVSGLHVALNCGGSDAFSSLTANPALGVCSDMLVRAGGTVSLAEIPECTGAEEILASRCATPAVKARLDATFAWWNDYASRHRVALNENLAPGNIEGGITTIVEKSLGAVTKAGTSALTQVVDYAETITERGFVLMNTPGFDPVSVTGLVAGGANLVGFTTGRGSVYGCAIAPTVKIATNSELFKRMSGDMDLDAGQALGERSLAEVGEDLFRLLVAVASGEKTKSEVLGLGWEEFAPWPVGETL